MEDFYAFIGPLVLLGAVMALHKAKTYVKLSAGGIRIVLWNGNESAFHVKNAGRAASAPILAELIIFKDTKIREETL